MENLFAHAEDFRKLVIMGNSHGATNRRCTISGSKKNRIVTRLMSSSNIGKQIKHVSTEFADSESNTRDCVNGETGNSLELDVYKLQLRQQGVVHIEMVSLLAGE